MTPRGHTICCIGSVFLGPGLQFCPLSAVFVLQTRWTWWYFHVIVFPLLIVGTWNMARSFVLGRSWGGYNGHSNEDGRKPAKNV